MSDELLAGDATGDEVASAIRVFRELDKAGRGSRTYGLDNQNTARFLEQLTREVTQHLSQWPVLAVVVEREELRMGEHVVLSGDQDLAHRLHGDGVRELRFEIGIQLEDLRGFVDALFGQMDPADSADEDVVTRLWSRDLRGVSVVTAEDIVKLPTSLLPQESGFFAPPPSNFRQVLDNERALTGISGREGASTTDRMTGSGVAGFTVTEAERASIQEEIKAERSAASVPFVVRVLQAILLSEKSNEVQERALSVVPPTLDTLLAAGAFAEADSLLESLSIAAQRYDETRRMLAERVAASLNVPVRVALLSVGLANAPAQPPGLAEVLRRLSPSAGPSLCSVLADAEKPAHRQLLRDTIGRLCSEHPEPVLSALLDPRTDYVRDLISIIAAWDLPRTTQALGNLSRHADVGVRIEAVNTLAQLAFGGDGRALFAFAFDEEQQVRQRALRQLGSGNYQLTFEFWRPKLVADDINALPLSSRRALLNAVQATSGDSAIPYLQTLLTERGWTQRKEREETALLAVQTLQTMYTPRAKAAMRDALGEAGGAVKKALLAALEGKEK